MSNSASQNATLFETNPPPVAPMIIASLAVWLGGVFALGASGVLAGPPGAPPLPIFAGAVVPLIVFAIVWRTSKAFRGYLLALDVRLVTAIQAWRYAGFGFIALYANHVLPGLFAWPAGLGDMAIGITAPWWVLKLIRDPGVAASPGFRLWNVLGIVDFVVAFTTATISAMLLVTDTPPSMAPMPFLPVVLIPIFMVPLFAMLHVIALLQSTRARPVS